MNLYSANIDIRRVREFLVSRGWKDVPSLSRYERLRAPHDLIPDYYLTLPYEPLGQRGNEFLLRVIANIAELYETSIDQLIALFERPQQVFSLQICGAQYREGTIPLLAFEAVIDRLKKTLIEVASFVSTGEQTPAFPSGEALTYIEGCRFLQTEVGSFVAKVSMPTDICLRHPRLGDEAALVSNDVNTRFEEILALITKRVFSGDRNIYSDIFLEDSMDLLCVGAIDNLRDLFIKSGADEINFRFLKEEASSNYESGVLTDDKFDGLHSFVKYLRENLIDNIALNAHGKVIELRSYNPNSRRNYVKISTADFGGAMIAVVLNNEQYALASSAHLSGRTVHVSGRARKMKTQLKIIELADFSVM